MPRTHLKAGGVVQVDRYRHGAAGAALHNIVHELFRVGHHGGVHTGRHHHKDHRGPGLLRGIEDRFGGHTVYRVEGADGVILVPGLVQDLLHGN